MIATLLLAATLALPARPASFATDTTHTLRAATVQSLNSELQSYYSATGNTVFVWVGNSTGDTPLEDWTVAAATKWKVGQAKKDDGAILFVFMQDHKARIEVGYGLEGTLTDAASSRIIRDTIVPKMRAGNPDGAIAAGVDAMLVTATPSYAQKLGRPVAPVTSAPDQSGDDGGALIFIVIVIIIALGVISIALRRGKGSWIMAAPLFWGGSGGGGFSGGSFGGGGFSGGFGGGFGGGGASGGW